MFGIQNLNDHVSIDIRDIRPGDVIASVGTDGYTSIFIGIVEHISNGTVHFADNIDSGLNDKFYFISRPKSDGQRLYEAIAESSSGYSWNNLSEYSKGVWEKRANVAKELFSND